jgi:serine/threonine protein kinase
MRTHTTLNSSGTASYRAPEVITHHEYNKKVDLWAIGCIFFEVIFRRKAFSSDYAVQQYAFQHAIDPNHKLQIPPDDSGWGDQLPVCIVASIHELLDVNSLNRPSAKDLLISFDSIPELRSNDVVADSTNNLINAPLNHNIGSPILEPGEGRI